MRKIGCKMPKLNIALIGLNNADVVVSSFFEMRKLPFTFYPHFFCVEFFDYLFTGQYDQLGNVKFFPYYVAGIGGLLLLSIFSSRSRQVYYG